MARQVQEVNAGSMADIAFLLLVFFLMTTTMDTDTGLPRMLPPPVPKDEPEPPPVKDRNVFTILLNSDNKLLVEEQYMEVSQLKEATKEFIENKSNEADKPEKKEKEIPFFGVYPVSKAVISVRNDNQTQYQAYLSVQNEIVAAYNELRNELAKSKFKKSFKELDEEEQDAIKDIYPMAISEAEPKESTGSN